MTEYTHQNLVQDMGYDWTEHMTDDCLAFVRELGETFGPDCTLQEAQLRLTERALEQEQRLYQDFRNIAEELAGMLATAEGLEERGEEWIERYIQLTSGRYHEMEAERKAAVS